MEIPEQIYYLSRKNGTYGATTGKITVEAFGETGTSADDFTLQVPLNIAHFNPPEAKVGDVVNIYGSGFNASASANVVRFNKAVATVISATETLLQAVAPLEATTGKITVEANGLITTTETDFTLRAASISDFTPAIAQVGTTVTINGNGFSTNVADNVISGFGVASFFVGIALKISGNRIILATCSELISTFYVENEINYLK